MKNVLEYLEHSTNKHPDKIAVIDEFGKCTYSELKEMSQKIASGMPNLNNQPILVLMDKGIETLQTFFGILYSGNFYVLMNPDIPTTRMQQMIDVLECQLMITNEKYLELAKSIKKSNDIILVEDLKKTEIDEVKLKAIRNKFYDINPLYTNFTSGSTGVPKGVVVGHRSVIDFIDVFVDTFEFDENDIFANQAPFDFDVSTKDIYSAMKVGGTLVIVPKQFFSKPTELLDFLVENKVTVMVWAVSALCLISTFHGLDYKTPDTVKKILFSGEVMPMKHLKTWMSALKDTTFVNLYGPTEITCNCTYHVIERDRDYQQIPIGKAFENEKVFLLDKNNKEVISIDVPGEVCVSGTALALGYFNAAEQTNKAFMQNPLNHQYIELIYRTGDLAKYDEVGDLYFVGRKDFQIKHMGHRIELEEIEKAMGEVEGVQRACCVYDHEKSKLYGFYIGSLTKREIRAEMAKTLPEYMIPNALRQVSEMPMNKNGKIDRKELLRGEKERGRK